MPDSCLGVGGCLPHRLFPLRRSLPRWLVFTASVIAASVVAASVGEFHATNGDDGRKNKVSWQQLPYVKALSFVVVVVSVIS